MHKRWRAFCGRGCGNCAARSPARSRFLVPGGDARLGWYDGAKWVNAVEGDSGGTPAFAGSRAYNATTDLRLGTYGVDPGSHVVWAVVNHGGTFGVALNPELLKKTRGLSHDGTASTLTVDSFTGHTYQLQRAASLAADGSGFLDAGSAQSGSTGSVLSFSANDGAAAQGFYRLKVEL